MSKKIWQWELLDSKPVKVGERTITPQARVMSVRLPFGGFVWNRPAAVLVEENGRIQRLPIPDSTRMMILAAAAVSTAVALLIKLQSSKVAE
jgi:hypothetical protein